MRLALGVLDRLVALLEERDGCVSARDAACHLLVTARVPAGIERSLLAVLVEADARLVWREGSIALAEPDSPALARARFVVFDLETTGLATPGAEICEIGAVRVQGSVLGARFETLVAPVRERDGALAAPTGVSAQALRAAPPVGTALRRFCAFAGDAVLVAHNARFDLAFVNQELRRLAGERLSAPVIDTLPLARNLLRGRLARVNLASLAYFFGVSSEPCHRALPDALATAEVLVCLLELARERGVSTLAELVELAAPASRRPRRPGVAVARGAAR